MLALLISWQEILVKQSTERIMEALVSWLPLLLLRISHQATCHFFEVICFLIYLKFVFGYLQFHYDVC